MARVISVDDITSSLRVRLEARADRPGRGPAHRLTQRLSDLVECPLCTGWWASLAISMMWPGKGRIRRGVSVAGVQAMLALAERLVSERGRDTIHQADLREAPKEDGQRALSAAPLELESA